MVDKDISSVLQKDWALSASSFISEDELLAALEKRIANILATTPEQFFQLMYKLDISEAHVRDALSGSDPTTEIARLVLERQKQKIESRNNLTPPRAPESDLSW